MKMKKCSILMMTYLIVSQSVFGLGVTIINDTRPTFENGKTNQPAIDIDPVWTGSTRGWARITKNTQDRMYYKTGLHHLKGLLVRNSRERCYFFDFEKMQLRGTGDITIALYDNDANAFITGHTDIVRKEATKIAGANVSGLPIDCAKAANYK